jgi:hypothetical protein
MVWADGRDVLVIEEEQMGRGVASQKKQALLRDGDSFSLRN